jgi:glutamine synthetase type III
MAALIQAIFEHGDLMRMSFACPGNDFRYAQHRR